MQTAVAKIKENTIEPLLTVPRINQKRVQQFLLLNGIVGSALNQKGRTNRIAA
jgi:hypothetical protein